MFGRDVTSNASNPSASSSAASAACRSGRLSRLWVVGYMEGLEVADETLESQTIAVGPEPRDHSYREIGQQRAAPLRLARKDVREVDLDERHPHGEQRIAHRETRVREGRRIDQCAGGLGRASEALNRLHQLALVVRLGPGALSTQPARPLPRRALDLRQAGAAVHLRLALTQQV